jgi:hypothetical protein
MQGIGGQELGEGAVRGLLVHGGTGRDVCVPLPMPMPTAASGTIHSNSLWEPGFLLWEKGRNSQINGLN